ncbi:tRNA epoxyqueuosine(34) reductase QueG [Mechercharimyces sp. CAU 1602]|uniref:tRNA epoxyqueuosine(34) reductase QueG n=1 Tax=Mechercharimyces sp. CAU 1602 TaxID=2973933 RepID=UPI0021618429|nr:tRNA epoxyqueuosine(34) reductase QueG [Mechercharimyces sp. CAU 1602]MCS1351713.1 tRNA epoxyqueuosine(34) reductase QueG [Mechercharimyces sp. CAU 1602]
MHSAEIKAALQAYAGEIGIDQIGFASADPFVELKERLVRHRELGYESGFEEPDLKKRTEPTETIPAAKSIIAIALAYPSKMPHPPRSKEGEYRGIFARASWGTDYHHVLRAKLEKLQQKLLELVPVATSEIMVDTGVLSDRAVAERAGIGWSGKNTSILSPHLGSWIYLGEMVTDIYLPPDQPVTQSCGECTACMDACPTGALVQPGQLNAQACIAYLTQTKGFLAEQYREKLGNRLYGCDTCQVVCPINRKVNFTHQEAFTPDVEEVKPLLKPLLTMSNRQFKNRFGHMAGSWRGKKPLQRNTIIALAHFKDHSSIPLLQQLLQEDPRPVIRGTSAWALGKIGGESAMEALQLAQVSEEDEEVCAEIAQALIRLEKESSHREEKENVTFG